MPIVTMPQLDVSITEATISRWLKQPGDHVAKYEPLVEVVTDKVNVEVPSPFEGTLVEQLVGEGETVPNDAPIARLANEGDESATTPHLVETRAVPVVGSGDRVASPPPTVLERAAGPAGPMTPAVRKLLLDSGLSPEDVQGTGGGGRISREDVLTAIDARRPAPAISAGTGMALVASPAAPAQLAAEPVPGASPEIRFPDGADEVLVPLTQMRRGIAAQMTRALSVPHAYVHMEVDVTTLVRLRDAGKQDNHGLHGMPLSYTAFVVAVVAKALRRHATFNAHWTQDGLLAKRRVNVGVAVAVAGGLVVPVIRDVDQLSVVGINGAIAAVAARAREGRLRADDFGGGTFTLDNTGWFGSNLTMPIINAPEVAILTMEAIKRRPVVIDTPDGEAVGIRPVMNMVLGIDHRANDGAQAGTFLRDIKMMLEGIGREV